MTTATAASPFYRVLGLLESVHKNGSGFKARCPAHDDRNPSLTIHEGDDGKVLLHCHAGCDSSKVVRALGLSWKDLMPDRIAYPVKDSNGRLQAIHQKVNGPNGSKTVYWVKNLPLYGSERLSEWPDPIIVTEGEPAAQALIDNGFPAVGTVCGAATTPDTKALEPLAGRRVVLWPDADHEGRKHMAHVGASLRELGCDVRWFAWETAPEKADAVDYLARLSVDGLRVAIERAPVWEPEMVSAHLKDGVWAETKLLFKTARQIADETPAEVEWQAKPYVVKGAITEIDGRVKASGKTTFALGMTRKILDGTEFMGQPTRQSGVVYLTEQAPASFRPALERAGLLGRDDLLVLAWNDTVGTTWPDVVAQARAKAKELGYSVLVVDTLGQFSGINGDAENNAGAALEAMQPLQEAAAQNGLAVIVNRHDRKSGGDVGESGRGSSAFAGTADIVLQLRRPEGKVRPTVRLIHALSRFTETPPEQVIELVGDEYVTRGTEQDVAAQEALAKVLQALPTNEGDAIAFKDICEAVKTSRSTIQRALDEHQAAGVVRSIGQGKKNDPKRYWQVPDLVSAQSPRSLGGKKHNGKQGCS
jgi:putative DNA primase/helicase